MKRFPFPARRALRPLILSVLAAAVVLPAQAGDTLAKIASTGKITVAYRESSVPFSYLDGTRPVGLTMDMSNAIVAAVRKQLKRPDIKVEMQAVTSQNRIPLLTNGTIDLECGSTTNNSARAKEVDFAINHFYTGTRLAVKARSGIHGYADLKGKVVAVTTGTTNVQVMRKYLVDHHLDAKMVMAKDHADAFLMVETGRADAFAMDDVLLFGLIANSRTPHDYAVVGTPLQVEPYACMLRKDDPRFKTLVDGTIGHMMKSGEFTRLYTRWFMQPIPPRNVRINMPMGPQLKANLRNLSDRPAT